MQGCSMHPAGCPFPSPQQLFLVARGRLQGCIEEPGKTQCFAPPSENATGGVCFPRQVGAEAASMVVRLGTTRIALLIERPKQQQHPMHHQDLLWAADWWCARAERGCVSRSTFLPGEWGGGKSRSLLQGLQKPGANSGRDPLLPLLTSAIRSS